MTRGAANKERIAELDGLRGLAFLAVVLQHAIGSYIRRPETGLDQAIALGSLFNLAKFAVPTFVFITGIVLVYNYGDTLHYPSFIRKRGGEILLPYVLWTGIYDFYYNGVPALDLAWGKELFHRLVTGTGAYHLWFVVMIFQFYLGYPLCRKLFQSLRRHRSASVTAVVLGGCAIGYALLMWLSATYIPVRQFRFDSDWLHAVLIQYRDRNALFYSFYFILGGVAGLALETWRKSMSRAAVWNAGFMLVLFLWVGQEMVMQGKIDLNRSTSLKPSMFLFTVLEMLVLYALVVRIAKMHPRLQRFLSAIGTYSYGAYLIHALVLNCVISGLNRWIGWNHALGMTMVACLLAASVSLLLTKAISLLPYGKLFIGQVRKRAVRAPAGKIEAFEQA
ncbi:acyltransferase [Brevibacillus sp. SYP-B805]|uniref:acyltransferase n=1 Tax=Brevibacillus sp. SYP-B805 TaxID=1578199 RepID=UPI0013EB1028|nr:acyltransferase [Brevibacillus sp. SYP-B805]NGQ94245.1 acyltransferase [Brevibacillus sp. SYP-B805]